MPTHPLHWIMVYQQVQLCHSPKAATIATITNPYKPHAAGLRPPCNTLTTWLAKVMVSQWYWSILCVGPHALPKTGANMAQNNPSMIFMLEKVENNVPQISRTTIYNDQLLTGTNSSSPAIPPVTTCSKKAQAIGNSHQQAISLSIYPSFRTQVHTHVTYDHVKLLTG